MVPQKHHLPSWKALYRPPLLILWGYHPTSITADRMAGAGLVLASQSLRPGAQILVLLLISSVTLGGAFLRLGFKPLISSLHNRIVKGFLKKIFSPLWDISDYRVKRSEWRESQPEGIWSGQSGC